MTKAVWSFALLSSAFLFAPRGAAQGTGSSDAHAAAAEISSIGQRLEPFYIDLHQNPELGFGEKRTAAKLAERLKGFGFEVTTGVGKTGVVGLLRNGEGPTVMLRTEMDALPVEEKTGLPFASKAVVTGENGQPTPVKHACGHDLHMSAWSGTAEWMVAHRDRWHGTLMLVGQPAEEIGFGASGMIDDGLFKRFPRPDFALSLHDDDTLPAGQIGYHAGYFRAAADFYTVTIFGRGGHGAMPQNTVDPIVLAARIILAWQTVVSRETDPQQPAVITVGSIHGGTRNNIIPDSVQLQVSIRTFDPEVRKHVNAAVERIAKGEAAAAGAPREPLIAATPGIRGAEAVYNDPAMTERLASALKRAMGPENVVAMPAKMTSEDFSAYGRAGVPSVLLHIGAVDPAKLEEARRTGVPVPAPHSPQWAPVLEPTLKAAILAETSALLELFHRQ